MNEEENQTTVEEVVDPQAKDSESDLLEEESQIEVPIDLTETSEILVTSPIDPRTMTIIETENNGDIHVIHEITLGDVILSTLLLTTLIFMVLERVIRR